MCHRQESLVVANPRILEVVAKGHLRKYKGPPPTNLAPQRHLCFVG